ncbi:DUF1643 domain-containing protein [Staphylococcus sp. IVB6214]|uniref:DUF1643 domain-containing protein n=1 Tax=Staphylococcus sp. IVB6214 TaxID=2989766 RepID=UPI0021D29F18|nr:DUF1643 domain-containing protein [Staphylococcus sp. IVB6214]UXR82558.1 DUF1643 domain-containing protein [Staphylococcus sp. IVB6214]
MENITNTLVTTAIFDEKRTHRYLLTKTWDDSKKTATVITMYPNYDGIINIDLTTQLIINQLLQQDIGTVHFVNLYSNITTPKNLKHLKEAYDKHTDIHLMKAISESETVILAYGAYAKRPVVVERVEQVLEMLKPHKKKIKKLINPATNEIMHPLNPKARQKWTLK